MYWYLWRGIWMNHINYLLWKEIKWSQRTCNMWRCHQGWGIVFNKVWISLQMHIGIWRAAVGSRESTVTPQLSTHLALFPLRWQAFYIILPVSLYVELKHETEQFRKARYVGRRWRCGKTKSAGGNIAFIQLKPQAVMLKVVTWRTRL